MKLPYLLLCSYVTYATCRTNTKNPPAEVKIVCGNKTSVDDVPHQAAFEYDGKFKFGATLIAPTWLITAAHFFKVFTEYLKRGAIRIGTSFKGKGGSLFNISNVITHPEYDGTTFQNDLALVQIKTAVAPNNKNASAIHFPNCYPKSLVGLLMTYSGFGQTEGATVSSELKSKIVSGIQFSDCKKVYVKQQSEAKVFCTTGGACDGDVGGAVTYRKKIIGIIAAISSRDCTAIPKNCVVPQSAFRPVLVMNLKEYYTWIKKYTNLTFDNK